MLEVLAPCPNFGLRDTILTCVRYCVTLMPSLEGKGVFEVCEIMFSL